MGISVYNAVDDLISLINDEWGKAGDVGQTPRLEKVWEEKKVGFVDDRRDIVVIEPVDEDVKYFGFIPKERFLNKSQLKIFLYSIILKYLLDSFCA